jgi:hypothetical protein
VGEQKGEGQETNILWEKRRVEVEPAVLGTSQYPRRHKQAKGHGHYEIDPRRRLFQTNEIRTRPVSRETREEIFF